MKNYNFFNKLIFEFNLILEKNHFLIFLKRKFFILIISIIFKLIISNYSKNKS